ncbi:hypothetical protein HUO13_16165 [Saccharopolyspora erythraea]|uniref:hypothetical protein n=1 Tax=Saccharopolyspora erythraea TaxID=1836 RepID=UPI001BA49DAA|nr:hypothetical protein [Saccharopolyspora erythraea]QUH02121.1 hypothetical protein HUO13_16165 [Saccharopolyspora erythraea]
MSDEQGRIFREAWIAGVTKHYPGEPKPGYIASWDDTPDWERASAAAVYQQVHDFIVATDGNTAKLTREQKGRFVATCWIGQIYRHIPDPKPAYIADWADMPEWQKETEVDIFERIEAEVAASTS